MSILKWIFGLLRKMWELIAKVGQIVAALAQSVVTWVVAGVVYVLHLVFQYVGDFFEDVFEGAAGISLGTLEIPPFARWLANDVVALNVAWEVLVIYIAAWTLTRVGRASFSVVRLMIDIL